MVTILVRARSARRQGSGLVKSTVGEGGEAAGGGITKSSIPVSPIYERPLQATTMITRVTSDTSGSGARFGFWPTSSNSKTLK
jgi:hypothetical protein